jgi:hypothetical protein
VTVRADLEKPSGIGVIVNSPPIARMVAFVMLVSKGRNLNVMSHCGNEE